MKLCCGIAFLAALTAGAQTPAAHPSPVGVWRTRDSNIQWVYAPKELGYRERGGNAAILRFSPDHKFALIYDTIYEQDGRETASAGDSWTVFYGTWRQDNGRLLVSYAPAYIDIPLIKNGRMTCDPPVKDRALPFSPGSILFGKEKLQPAPRLEQSVNEFFKGPTGHELSCGNFENGHPYPQSEPRK